MFNHASFVLVDQIGKSIRNNAHIQKIVGIDFSVKKIKCDSLILYIILIANKIKSASINKFRSAVVCEIGKMAKHVIQQH
jgi:hypothetical protein